MINLLKKFEELESTGRNTIFLAIAFVALSACCFALII